MKTAHLLTPESLSFLISKENTAVTPVILCIGTDRIIGDCLGPLTGSILRSTAPGLPVYGTLQHPVHALNFNRIHQEIKKKHPHSLIIAVDASLGSFEHIHSVFVRTGSISPGSGVHKQLPPAGNIAITGIVNEESSHPYLSLQTTRLSTVTKMAQEIADCLNCVIQDIILPTC